MGSASRATSLGRSPAIILDFGNVLAFFDYGHVAETFALIVGETPEAVWERFRAPALTEVTALYECGKITTPAFVETMNAVWGQSWSVAEFGEIWNGIFSSLNRPLTALLPYWKALGYPLVMGSNTNDLHARWFLEAYAEAFAPFDAFVLSHQAGVKKPDPAFYRICAEAAGRAPNACLFIDDLAENVAAARDSGMSAHHFRNLPDLLETLASFGIPVTPRER